MEVETARAPQKLDAHFPSLIRVSISAHKTSTNRIQRPFMIHIFFGSRVLNRKKLDSSVLVGVGNEVLSLSARTQAV